MEVILALASLIGGSVISYLVVLRKASGTIGTSEASQLWEESRAIREWATAQIERLEGEVKRLEGMHRACQKECRRLQRQLNEEREKAAA